MTALVWPDEQVILTVHERLLVLHGGAPGLRDPGLLQSALARPRQHLAYGGPSEITQLAALLTGGILRNHPFIDGNKRVAFVAGVLFLELNSHHFAASEEEAVQAMLALAASEISEADYAAFLAANST